MLHSVKIWLAVQPQSRELPADWTRTEKTARRQFRTFSCPVLLTNDDEKFLSVVSTVLCYCCLKRLLIRWWIDNCTPLPYIGHRHSLVVSMASLVAQPILCYLLTLKCCWVNQLFIQGHMLLSRQKAGPGLWNESRRDSMHKHIIHNNVKHTFMIPCSTDGFYLIAGMLQVINQLPAASVTIQLPNLD